ncbi:hypothetical protein MXMO3_02397 [Maritalea myrionectae]|uniref:Uncharacterized protein n=1 Tax=Maritalea myrionectae TaxID=454601 RepID=A0A2R4MFY4_9HYPH|nr:hypothetical protein [Maritalea myrionectae]AVX04910.1 hypothetical protein MXMO3_02397 [Maritalea myrionectae]
MKFERPGIGARVGQLGYLLKHTFTIVARDDDIIVPVLKMSAMAVLVVCLFFWGHCGHCARQRRSRHLANSIRDFRLHFQVFLLQHDRAGAQPLGL